MAGAAVTFLSVTLAYVILRLRVAREKIGFLSVTDTHIQTISEIRCRISCLAVRRSAIIFISFVRRPTVHALGLRASFYTKIL